MKNAGKSLSLLSTLEKFLDDVYKFYHYSPLNWTGLQETGDALGIKVVRPVNIYGTRWAGHRHRALQALNTDYVAIHTHCTQVSINSKGDSASKAKHILDCLQSLELVLFMHMMLFYFAVCALLSDTFQDNDTSIDLIPVRMHAACVKLTETNFDKMAEEFMSELQDGQYRTVTLEKKKRGSSTEATVIKRVKTEMRALSQNTAEALYSRIAEFEGNSGVMEAFSIFTPVSWPENRSEFGTFGREEINKITEHFSEYLRAKNITRESCMNEMPDVLMEAADLFKKNPDCSYIDLWSKVLKQDKMYNRYNNILALVKISLVLAVSSAECERGFSMMSRVKTDWRSRLKPLTLSQLMTVAQCKTPLEDFDPRGAIARWMTGGKGPRRWTPAYGTD
ncbi:zinc finger protein 862-like [Haliotis asinina]|uniref:zinc finger protein 862-like n=1 Tax=Haliotis asinina TaxID=109174 RepID=UPI003531E48D